MRTAWVLASIALWGCKGGGETDEDTDVAPPDDTDVAIADRDADGAPDEEDCLPDDPTAYPGAPDTAYDGVDSDCDGADDYDADGDGHVPDAYAGLSTLVPGDCDDTNADVFPGAAEVWYSGEDEPCDGGDDWDQDGDGWQKGSIVHEPARDAYAAEYGLELPDAQWGDCDDTNPDAWPGAPDEWSDGVDTDCDGADELDRDGDGYRDDALGGDDCDDEDPNVHPDQLETLGDGVDVDCDGREEPAIATDGTCTNPRPVVALAEGDRYLLVSAADDVSWSGTLAWPVFALWWEAPGGAPDDRVVWHNGVASSAGETGAGLAAIATTAGFVGTIGYHKDVGSVSYSYQASKAMSWNGAGYDAASLKVSSVRESSEVASDADIQVTTGGVWSLGCAPDRLWWLYEAVASTTPVGGTSDLYGGDTCVLEPSATPDTAHATVCDGAACTRYDIDASGIAVSASQPWSLAYTVANRRGDWVVLVEPDGGVTLAEDGGLVYADLLSEHADVRDADAAWHDGTLFVALAVGDRSGDGLGDAILAWGTPDALDSTVLSFDDGSVVRDLAHVSVHAGDDAVFLAFSGDDGIGWAFAAR